DEYLDVVSDAIKRVRRGVCIRLHREDLMEFADFQSALLVLVTRVGTCLQDSHLLVDFRALPQDTDAKHAEVSRFFDSLPRLHDWQALILAATGFPENLMGYPPSDVSFIPRREWQLWRTLLHSPESSSRVPTFSDYGISHPEPSEVDPRVMRASASVRYTTED